MHRFIGRLTTFAVLLLLSSFAQATLIFDDGGSYVIDSPVEDVRLENGTHLEVTTGGEVSGPSGDVGTVGVTSAFADRGVENSLVVTGTGVVRGGAGINRGGDAVRYAADTSFLQTNIQVSVSGEGRIEGGVGGTTGGAGLGRRGDSGGGGNNTYLSGSARVTGGSGGVTGGVGMWIGYENYISDNALVAGGDGGVTGGDGLVRDFALGHVTISGGEVRGGSGGTLGGDGIDPDIEFIALTMSDGLVRGGDGGESGGSGMQGSADGRTFVTLSGGTIQGGNGGVTGGAALGKGAGQILRERLLIDMSGGTLRGGNGGLYGGSAIEAQFARPGVVSDANVISISGGKIDAGSGSLLDGWLIDADFFSLVEITGGRFGYEEAGLGFLLGSQSVFDIFGYGLELDDGYLTGTLLDGNWINVPVAFADDFTGSFNLHDVTAGVPEPGTLGLLAVGLAGIGFARRRRTG